MDAGRVRGVLTTTDEGAVRPTSMREDTVSAISTALIVDPEAPFTRKPCVPAGVARVVESVNVLEQLGSGAHLSGLKDADTPAGSGRDGSSSRATA